MANTNYLQLTFLTSAGSRKTISLDSPRADLTEAEATAAMDEVISRNIFFADGGDLVSKYRARIVDKVTTDLYEA